MKISIKKSLLYIVSTTAIFACNPKNDNQETQHKQEISSTLAHADPFIGTGGHGHTYPGATAPFGMVQVSPDNGRGGWDWCSGYHYPDTLITGFSHLHLSGTGIGDLVDLLFMPTNKEIDLTKPSENPEKQPYTSSFSHKREWAHPGYYEVFLDDPQIDVQLTASRRTAYHQYTFRENDQKSVIIDLGFSINWDHPTHTALHLEDDHTITGQRNSTGWAKNQKVFFVAQFSDPITKSVLVKDRAVTDSVSAQGERVSSQLFFDGKSNKLRVKLALSSVSIENAKENLDEGTDFDFETEKQKAEKTWDANLSAIAVKTPVDSLKTIFYSALYHANLSPVTFSDKNGEFRLQNDSIASAKGDAAYSTLSLWDTFRAEQPLLTLTQPDRVADIINSMLAYYSVNKALPVWNLYGNETNTMTGYHSVAVIAEAYVKGIRGFDAEKAYEAMKTTMMGSARGLDYYKKHGFIPYEDMDENVTMTLEYGYDDWCMAQMAKGLGKEDDYEYFSKRSESYQKLFDPGTGFMRGHNAEGELRTGDFDPKRSEHRENTDYTEGNAWQHSWFAPHDTDGLIALYGGKDKFAAKLEQLFTTSSEITGGNSSPDISGLIGQYAHGNEPSHHIAYLFNRAGKPWRTQYWVRQILKTQYNTTPNGLAGNEDAGQMSAWYVFSSMGLYPLNPASAEYEIGSPLFEETTLHLPNGKRFKISTQNNSDTNIYIQSATLNGQNFNRTAISHKTILSGGELKLIMGPEPNKEWGVE